MHNSCNDAIITTSNILGEINHQKLLQLIIVLPQVIIHQLSVDSATSTSIIISV